MKHSVLYLRQEDQVKHRLDEQKCRFAAEGIAAVNGKAELQKQRIFERSKYNESKDSIF